MKGNKTLFLIWRVLFLFNIIQFSPYKETFLNPMFTSQTFRNSERFCDHIVVFFIQIGSRKEWPDILVNQPYDGHHNISMPGNKVFPKYFSPPFCNTDSPALVNTMNILTWNTSKNVKLIKRNQKKQEQLKWSKH